MHCLVVLWQQDSTRKKMSQTYKYEIRLGLQGVTGLD